MGRDQPQVVLQQGGEVPNIYIWVGTRSYWTYLTYTYTHPITLVFFIQEDVMSGDYGGMSGNETAYTVLNNSTCQQDTIINQVNIIIIT